ncbi:MAG: acylphosphatase [Deferribacterales bacterium]
MRRVTATVRGRVQGVGYRASVHRRICMLNVTGYVRNLPDGTVELDIQGHEADVEEALEIAHDGSPFSSVDSVDTRDMALSDLHTGFVIKK